MYRVWLIAPGEEDGYWYGWARFPGGSRLSKYQADEIVRQYTEAGFATAVHRHP